MKRVNILVFLIIFSGRLIFAANYYCDPATGSMSNDGSKSNPWSTLQAVFEAHKSFVAGDTIFLFKGYHGTPLIFGRNENYVNIRPVEGDTALVSSIKFSSASYWQVENLVISSESPESKDVYDFYFLITTSKNSNFLTFRNCRIYSTENSENWTRDDWFNRTASGLFLESTNTIIENNYIKNINFGMEVRGRFTDVSNNMIENFVGDAIRGLASFCNFEYNLVENVYDITGYYPSEEGSGNHDDGFQSYTSAVGGVEEVVENVVLRGNKFVCYTDPNQIEKGMMQGIACFDGYYYNWVVENNVVITDSWHGISFLGVEQSVIVNNTIMDNWIDNDLVIGGAVVGEMTPWIWVGPLKSDRGSGPSNDNIIRNNLLTQSKAGFAGYKSILDEGVNTIVENNIEVPTTQKDVYFVDFHNFDFHEKTDAPSKDAGVNIDLPVTDRDGNARLVGPAADAGAYEFNDGNVTDNCPVLAPLVDTTMEEEEFLDISVYAVDADNDPITLTTSALPSFMSFTDNGDGTGVLNIVPQLGHYGNYPVTFFASDGNNTDQRSFRIEITEKTSTSAQENKTEDMFLLYPNPASTGEISIRLTGFNMNGEINVSIFDLSGRVVYRSNFINESAGSQTFEISDSEKLTTGIYLVELANSVSSWKQKLIVY